MSHLAYIGLVCVFACGGPVGSKDGGPVAVGVFVDYRNGFIQTVSLQDNEHRSKDLLFITLHVQLEEQHRSEFRGKMAEHRHPGKNQQFPAHRNISKDGRSYKVSIFVSFDVDFSSIQQKLCTLVHPTLDQGLHPRLGFRGDEGPHVGPRLVTFRTETLRLNKDWTPFSSQMIPMNLPAFTRSDLDRSTSSGSHLRDSPTKTAVDRAIQRWPAAPKAAPTSWLRVFSLLASGITTPWFLAP